MTPKNMWLGQTEKLRTIIPAFRHEALIPTAGLLESIVDHQDFVNLEGRTYIEQDAPSMRKLGRTL